MTNEQHNKYIAYTFFGHAGFQLLMLLFFVVMFSFVIFIPTEPGKPAPPREFFGFMIAFMTVFQLMFTVPSIVAGYALLKRKSWARMAGIIGGVVAAMSVPVGTAACVYSLWFFLGENWKTIYPPKPGHSANNPQQIAYGIESQQAAYKAEEAVPTQTFDPYDPPDWR